MTVLDIIETMVMMTIMMMMMVLVMVIMMVMMMMVMRTTFVASTGSVEAQLTLLHTGAIQLVSA